MLPALLIALTSAGRFEIAPKAGLFEPTSRLSGAMFVGTEFGYLTPALGDRLAVVMEVDWVRPHASGTVSDPRVLVPGQSYSLHHTELGVLLSAVLRLPDLVPRLTPYGGAGPGLYFHRAATSAFGSDYVETEMHVGLQLLGGADFALGPGAGFAEIRYHFARVDFVSTGNANVGGFLALGLGYRFRF
jgi:opacity protein-like surface antigen